LANATLVKEQRVEVIEVDHRSRASILWLRTKDQDENKRVLYAICNVHLEGHPDKHKERMQQLVSSKK
jgi:hypothetical protein